MSDSTELQQAIRTDGIQAVARFVNLWRVALGVLAAVLLVGGAVTATIGLRTISDFDGTVLGQDATFDGGVATAIVGGVAILLGVAVGSCWLIIGALRWHREE